MFAALLLLGLVACAAPPTPPAYAACKQYYLDRMVAPSTARFAPLDSVVIFVTDSSRTMVGAHVDAQNGYGAMVRTNFFCLADSTSEGWEVVRVSEF